MEENEKKLYEYHQSEEFSVEELESRLEMKPWIEFQACDEPSHCHT
ncbi:hypothetical protein ACHRVW_04180 [Flavobacterium collinsii]|jgi:hypothetical protein|nr:hypothetical protein [Flavobacterium collinsii]GIQ59372.1 hypothetical protein Flavo103_25080 [Flavobacterium collinsii]